jgi:hypothetical protein
MNALSQQESSRSLWGNFKNAFVSNLQQLEDSKLWEVWCGCTARTSFYRDDLLPRVAKDLGMEHAFELYNLRVDFVMREATSKVPRVFIESENDAKDAINNEIPKLCALAAPLKVFITCVAWDETPGIWRATRLGGSFVREWEPVIRQHAVAWPQPSILGVIVAEWCDPMNDRLRFYSIAYDGMSGTRVEPIEAASSAHQGHVLFERNVSRPLPQ